MRAVLLIAAVAAAACTEPRPIDIGHADEGESCGQPSDCIAGLGCEGGTCVKLGPIVEGPQRGDPCTSDAECDPDNGLVCGRQAVCTTTLGAGAGESCALLEDCAAPLVCSGTTGECSAVGEAGTTDFGEACSELLDCRRPYVCGVTNRCEKLPIYLGPSCARSDAEMGAFRVYFELPPEGALPDDFEFDRLPFPSDVRVVDGRISLRGQPAPDDVLGLSVRDTYFRAIEEDVNGFATNQPIFFRTTDPIDPRTICLDAGGIYPTNANFCSSRGPATIALVDVDPDSPEYGTHVPVQLAMGREAGTYMCGNWVGIVPLDGRPLRQGTTYAALITSEVRAFGDWAPVHDADFAAILSGGKQVPAMQPLLAWMQDKGIDPATIAGATVFTTGVFETRGARLREAVHRVTPAPTFGPHVTCDALTVSPCDDGLFGALHERGCISQGTDGFSVIEGTYDAPMFQAGTRPYRHASDGGAFVLGTDGVPIPQGTETMCFAAAVPTTPPPPEGYPVVLFGHGTGGSFEGFLRDGIAERLTALGYVVVGFDNVLHGPRQQPPGEPIDPSKWVDPGNVFFNLANPRASRDNVLQGSADLFHLVRLVRNPESVLEGRDGPVRFDPARVVYYGHSQGTVIAPAFLAAESDLAAAVLSGAGADLALSVLNKTTPIDSAAMVGLFFGDRSLTRIHPMIGVLAMLFAEADALAYAPRWVAQPTLRGAPLPLLHVLGLGDTYTPDVTQHAQLRVSRLPLVGTVEDAITGIEAIASPARNNVNGVTAGAVQLRPDGPYDGHFVTYEHPVGRAAVTSFLESVRDGAPEIVK